MHNTYDCTLLPCPLLVIWSRLTLKMVLTSLVSTNLIAEKQTCHGWREKLHPKLSISYQNKVNSFVTGQSKNQFSCCSDWALKPDIADPKQSFLTVKHVYKVLKDWALVVSIGVFLSQIGRFCTMEFVSTYLLCILTSKSMLPHAFAWSKTMKNIWKSWKKYLFHNEH